MKKILIVISISILILSTFLKNSYAVDNRGPEALCSLTLLKFSSIISKAKAHSPRDKNRHCAISCMLTLRCNSVDVFGAGVLKEIYDIYGPGNVEMEDLVADSVGIGLGNKIFFGGSGWDNECMSRCDHVFMPK